MPSFHFLAKKVIDQADIVLLVLDARMPGVTHNEHLLQLVGEKKLIYVLNKIDLVAEHEWQEIKKQFRPCIAVSSTQHLGTMMLLRKINALARGTDVVVGVIGYPNTGKSSLINALRSRQSASVSPVAGHTKAIQKVRVSKHVLLLDTPGVLPYEEKKDKAQMAQHEILGTVDVHRIKDPELAFYKLVEQNPGLVQRVYGVDQTDPELLLEELAVLKKVVRAKGVPDTERMARTVLREYQTGKLR